MCKSCYFTFLLLLTLSGCGVTTDSSSNAVNLFHADSNNTDSNTSSQDANATSDSNSSDSNITGSASKSSPDSNETIFDSSDGALFDAKACDSAQMSAEPLQDRNEDDFTAKLDEKNGIELQSFFNQTPTNSDTVVTAYYDTIPSDVTLNGTFDKVLSKSAFAIAYDLAWVSLESNTVYVKTPKVDSDKPSCYKLVLNSEQGESLTAQKVYR